MTTFTAYVCQIQTNRAGDRSEKVRITVTYEVPGSAGSLEFDMPIEEARNYYAGQAVTISISPARTL